MGFFISSFDNLISINFLILRFLRQISNVFFTALVATPILNFFFFSAENSVYIFLLNLMCFVNNKLVSLFFGTMALIGGAGTVFVYLLLSTVVCDSVDTSFLICSFVTWFFVFFCFFTIVILPIYISIKTWK